jgi:hypothetical protein
MLRRRSIDGIKWNVALGARRSAPQTQFRRNRLVILGYTGKGVKTNQQLHFYSSTRHTYLLPIVLYATVPVNE